jgi:CubicO group peptidase (beta-lactamase class C family)
MKCEWVSRRRVTLPLGESTVHFIPVAVKSQLPDATTEPWPMGDVPPNEPLPAEINATKLKAAVDAAFEPPESLTAAFVVTWKGRLIAERYGDGIDIRTPLEGWSMGKSITATLLGVLLKKGVYKLTEPAPIPEWRTPVWFSDCQGRNSCHYNRIYRSRTEEKRRSQLCTTH